MKQRTAPTVEMLKAALTGNEIMWGLGGLGGAALENQHILPDLDENLKKVNLGIGATTGYLMANPAYRTIALGSLPFKELGLFAVSSADKLRKQQQSLVDANLGVARTNQDTAYLQRGNAAAEGRRALMFLLPAILAGGGIGYMGYNQWKKNRNKRPGWQTTGSTGTRHAGQKIRIDVPASAVPEEFFHSIARGEESPRAYTRFMEKAEPQPEGKAARAVLEKIAAAEDRMSIPSMLGNMAWDMTGIPGTTAAVRDLGRAGGEYSGEQYGEAARHGLGAAGNLLLALAGARMGAGFLGNRLGRRVLEGQMGRLAAHPPGQFRNLVKPLFKWGPDYNNTIAGINRRYAYDPSRYAWSGATSRNPLFRGLLTERPHPPGSLSPIPNQLVEGARYGANRALNTAYRGKQFLMRHPVMGPTVMGLPFATMGSVRDDRELAEARNIPQITPQWDQNKGPFGIPVSTALSTLAGAFGAHDPRTSIRSQMVGAPWDPWRDFR